MEVAIGFLLLRYFYPFTNTKIIGQKSYYEAWKGASGSVEPKYFPFGKTSRVVYINILTFIFHPYYWGLLSIGVRLFAFCVNFMTSMQLRYCIILTMVLDNSMYLCGAHAKMLRLHLTFSRLTFWMCFVLRNSETSLAPFMRNRKSPWGVVCVQSRVVSQHMGHLRQNSTTRLPRSYYILMMQECHITTYFAMQMQSRP